jgi:hypothetical protein
VAPGRGGKIRKHQHYTAPSTVGCRECARLLCRHGLANLDSAKGESHSSAWQVLGYLRHRSRAASNKIPPCNESQKVRQLLILSFFFSPFSLTRFQRTGCSEKSCLVWEGSPQRITGPTFMKSRRINCLASWGSVLSRARSKINGVCQAFTCLRRAERECGRAGVLAARRASQSPALWWRWALKG